MLEVAESVIRPLNARDGQLLIIGAKSPIEIQQVVSSGPFMNL